MIHISILEEDDIIKPTDFCRPLNLEYGDDGDVRTRATYSGQPINNTKWCRVHFVLGECWFGKKIKEYHSRGIGLMEFARGPIPNSHLLNMYEFNEGR